MIMNNNRLMRIILFLVWSVAATLAIAYSYLGYAGREAVAGGEGMIQKGMLALALLAVVAFLPRMTGNLRRGPMIGIPEFRQAPGYQAWLQVYMTM